ncbi:hypothetical protein AB0D59_20865 [Streptomyces sp. NPDC048417]|uniref:hypothetical protein n=1 Tax=Streptomyces sp. NPDC048417 TaxID=3155387 RepID=UPI0034417A4D
MDERETLIMGALAGGSGSAFLLVFDLFRRYPWQVILLLVAGVVVLGGLIAAMSLADVRRDADRRAISRPESQSAIATSIPGCNSTLGRRRRVSGLLLAKTHFPSSWLGSAVKVRTLTRPYRMCHRRVMTLRPAVSRTRAPSRP